MNEKSENFNLLEEDWIPVLWTDGRFSRVGIRKALMKADRIRQIAASNPMDRIAILRFLLALLYWCKGNPPAGGSGISGGSFPADCFSKLEANRDCFNLLGEGKRFYQDRNAQRSRASTDLIQEIPTGNNFWHFRHSTDRMDGLCPACCAMGLLRLPLFSVSGLPDLKSGINGTPPIYAVHWGMSLLDTLYAHWTPRLRLGDPSWVRPDISPMPGEDVPLLIGLTLLSRRVWLHDPAAPPGSCQGCGTTETMLIRTCEFQTAGKQENELWDDPHVVYLDQERRKTCRAPDLTATGKFRMDRPWPDLLARIIETGKLELGERTTSLLVVGFATDQAKNIDVWERIINKPSTGTLQETAASSIRKWQKEGASLTSRMHLSKRKLSSRRKIQIEIASTLQVIRPHVEDRVSNKAGALLAGGEDAWERAAREYRPMMEAIGKSLSPGFTTAAVQRRKQIAGVRPSMSSETPPAKKARGKKGGKK